MDTGISIILPTFNPGPHFSQSVASALSQLAPEDELLVQDGGSTDGSLDEVIKCFGTDPRLSVVSEPDKGQSDALNRGLRRARHEVIGWLNGDDLYLPGALDAARATFMGTRPIDVAYGAFYTFERDRIIRHHFPGPVSRDRLLTHGCFLFTGASFFRKKSLQSVGGFPDQYHYAMDYELYLRLCEDGAVFSRILPTIGAFRYHENSKSGSKAARFLLEVFRIRRTRIRGVKVAQLWALTLWHLLLLSTTPVRQSRWYGALRGDRTV